MFRFRAAEAVQSLSIKQRKCIFKNEMIGPNAVNHNFRAFCWSHPTLTNDSRWL